MALSNEVGDKRLAKIASPFIKRTPIQELIAENTFTLEEAAALVPMNSKATLVSWLFRHKHELPPPRYRDVQGDVGCLQIRVLTAEEIKYIRDMVMFGRGDARYRPFGVSRSMRLQGRG